jgi:hypothetical protein
MPLRVLDRALVPNLKTEVNVLRRRVPLRRSVPLPRGLPPKRIVPVRKMRLRPRRGPDRSPEYLAWIRTLGCVVCSRVGGGATVVEAAHTNVLGARGMGQKATDFSAIPLCSGHHRECPDSYHALGERGFLRKHGIDLNKLVLGFQSRFWQHDVSATRERILKPSTSCHDLPAIL